MRPKLRSGSKKAPARGKPSQDSRGAQTVPTPTRKDVREAVHLVRAPRQTRRPYERSAKKKS
jgi:hypothetical protein